MIETARLKLIPCELKHFEAILQDQGQLERLLGVTVLDNWFNFPGVASIEAIQFSYEYQKDSGRTGDNKYGKTSQGHIRHKILGRKTL